ncbi:hypothetical protein KHA80_08285 [Anaerobacillus sp. HL2]|nr:hypothetical protein KHA80_08285 [Anaerobacillus sp. HL2]
MGCARKLCRYEIVQRLYTSLPRTKGQSFELLTLYSKRIVEVKVLPNKDGLLCIFSNITEQKRKRKKEQINNEKLKMIGEMAAGVAHEVRNPMHC